jgi:single-strand DNA-binding protein
MASVNKVILIGNLGKEPECKCMPSGTQVTKFSLATNEKWKDKKTGEMQTKTEWHNIVMYNKLAERAAFLKKGMSVYIEGSISTNKWKDKDGQDKTTTNIAASAMQILSGMEEIKRQLEDMGGGIKNFPGELTLKNIPEHKAQTTLGFFADDDLPF